MERRRTRILRLWLILLAGLGLLGQPMAGAQAAPAADHEILCDTAGTVEVPAACCPTSHPCGGGESCIASCTVSCNAATTAAPLPVAWNIDHAPARLSNVSPVLLGPSRAVPPPERPPRA
jgi:hypothetical protein